MHLCKLRLDISSPSVRQAMRDCNDMHRNLMRAFDVDRANAGMLYRVVQTDTSVDVFVLSSQVGQWARVEPLGYHLMRLTDISALKDKYGNQAILRFSLLAYPSKKVAGGGKNSKRVLLLDDAERIAWLRRQGEKNGFAVLEAHQDGKEVQLSSGRSTGTFKLSGVPIAGVLQITDAEAFWRGYQQGIGPEKAYGLGLLMLSRG